MSAPSTPGGSVARWALNGFAALGLVYLFVPIIWIVAYSFNKPNGKFNFIWQRFTLDNWKDPLANATLTDSLMESLKIAAISTVIATVLGSMIAISTNDIADATGMLFCTRNWSWIELPIIVVFGLPR